ncbi:MAG: Uma2 family endonuclease [Solirubrobacteraceae bacterium]
MAIEVHHDALHRLGIEEYHQLVRAGGFDEDARVELLDGLIVDMSPKSPQHENAIVFLADWLRKQIDPATHHLRVAAPLTIGRSEPEPDLAVVTAPSPLDVHPAGARLVIEVSHTSRRRDLIEKPGLYAQAAICEYWVFDLDGRRAIRHADPREGAYRDVTTHAPGESVPGAGVGTPALRLDDVLSFAGM